MKRFFSVFTILLLLSSMAYALSYSAHITLYTGVGEAKVDDDMFRTSYTVTAELDALGLRFGRNTLSLPLTVSYFSESLITDALMLTSHADFSISLAYRYAFTDLFTLKMKAGAGYRLYDAVDASAITGNASIAAEFYPASYTAIIIPFDLYFMKDEVDFSLGIGFLFNIGGGK